MWTQLYIIVVSEQYYLHIKFLIVYMYMYTMATGNIIATLRFYQLEGDGRGIHYFQWESWGVLSEKILFRIIVKHMQCHLTHQVEIGHYSHLPFAPHKVGNRCRVCFETQNFKDFRHFREGVIWFLSHFHAIQAISHNEVGLMHMPSFYLMCSL